MLRNLLFCPSWAISLHFFKKRVWYSQEKLSVKDLVLSAILFPHTCICLPIVVFSFRLPYDNELKCERNKCESIARIGLLCNRSRARMSCNVTAEGGVPELGCHAMSLPKEALRKIPWTALTLYTLTSVCIFSILFSIHFLRCWHGEFV